MEPVRVCAHWCPDSVTATCKYASSIMIPLTHINIQVYTSSVRTLLENYLIDRYIPFTLSPRVLGDAYAGPIPPAL